MLSTNAFLRICFTFGILYLGVVIWESILTPMTTDKLNQQDTIVFCFITISYIKNMFYGSLLLLVFFNIINTREVYMKYIAMEEGNISFLDLGLDYGVQFYTLESIHIFTIIKVYYFVNVYYFSSMPYLQYLEL